MPTAYTDKLDDNPLLTTEKWLTVHLVRAFGITYPIRDDRDYETVEQIESKITEYYESDLADDTKRLSEARDELKKYLSYTDANWQKAYLEKIEYILDFNSRSIKEAEIVNKRHTQVIDDLNRIRRFISDKFTLDVVQFGLDQLKLVERETQPYSLREPTFAEFKEECLRHAERTVEFRKEDVEKAKEMLTFVGTFRKFVTTVHDVLKEN